MNLIFTDNYINTRVYTLPRLGSYVLILLDRLNDRLISLRTRERSGKVSCTVITKFKNSFMFSACHNLLYGNATSAKTI